MTSLLFRVISAHRCRSTHHHIAIGALTLLKGEHAQRWHDLMLVMHDDLLKGAKAPDAEFKDFKNHVLHIEEGEWGGARDAALEWYAKSVMALKAKKWSDAAYALGVMSHYYADPIQPFHTGQTEEEGAIHRAVEWSIAKSRPEIARRIDAKGYPVVPTGEGPGFVSNMVRAGAEKSHPHYQTFLDHYNVDAGVKVPEDGLDDTLLDVISDLVAYATSGLAAIYMRAFEEAGVAPPKSNLSINGFLATLDIPIRWITSKLEDANDRRIVSAMYEELRKTGKVVKKLPEDDKQIRKMHAQQVLRIPLKELDAQRMRKIGEKHVARAGAQTVQTETQSQPAQLVEDVTPIAASTASADTISTAATPSNKTSTKIDKKAERLAIKEANQAEKQRLAKEKADAKERAKAEKAAAAQAKIEAAANAKAEKVAALQAKADEEARIKAEEKAAAEKAATEKAEAAKHARADAVAKKEAEERAAAQAKATKQVEKDTKRKNRGQTDCNETAEAAALLAAAHKTAAQREAEQREAEQRAAAAAAATEAAAPVAAKQEPESTKTENQTEKPKYRVKSNGEPSESKSKEYDAAESAFAAQLKQVSKGTRFEPVENDPDEDMDVTTYDAMIDAMDDDDLGLPEEEASETTDFEDTSEEGSYAPSRTSRREPLSNESPIVDAPSIGKKTAARMRNVGIHTVGDFVQAKAKDLSAKLGGGYMTPATLIDWQDQALLMIDMPSLRVHDAQILVGAGVRCVEDLAESSSRDLFASAVSFLKTKDGARIAQNGNALDHEEVYDWIEEAQAAFA